MLSQPPLHRHAISPGRWFRLISFLVADNIGSRYRRSRAGAILAILEPLGIVALFSFTHSFGPAHRPPYGTSIVLFYASGVLPYYLFFHVSLRVRSWDTLVRLPSVTEFDLLLTQVLPEVIAKILVIVALDGVLWLSGTDEAIPRDPIACLVALAVLTVMGAAVGMINAVIFSFFAAWQLIYSILIRAMMAFSGVVFVVDMMPTTIRDIVAWIPTSHAVLLFRSGQYVGYPTMTLDISYMVWCMAGIGGMAWLLQASTREWRHVR